MARAINRLSAPKVEALAKARKPGRYADGGGLYLYVGTSGGVSWVFRYRDRTTQKPRDRGLGPLQDVPLVVARKRAAEARGALQEGTDPIDARREARKATVLARATARTFGDCADRYIAAHRSSWRNAKHGDQWRSTLDTYCADLLPLPVAAVDTSAVTKALEAIWADKTETATRVRQRIEAVLDWATARGYRHGDNPARWRGHLQKLLPPPAKLKNVIKRPALAYADMHRLTAQLSETASLGAQALTLQILTATRPGEAVGAQWKELDLEAGVWTIPGARMKANRPHDVPLPPRLLAFLKKLPRDPSGFLFPGKPGKPITTAATLKLLQGMEPGLSCHGFRSSFRDWAADQTSYPRDVAEAALAHAIKDKTEAAYRRTTMLEKRREMMAEWESHCFTAPPTGNVSSIGAARARTRA